MANQKTVLFCSIHIFLSTIHTSLSITFLSAEPLMVFFFMYAKIHISALVLAHMFTLYPPILLVISAVFCPTEKCQKSVTYYLNGPKMKTLQTTTHY